MDRWTMKWLGEDDERIRIVDIIWRIAITMWVLVLTLEMKYGWVVV